MSKPELKSKTSSLSCPCTIIRSTGRLVDGIHKMINNKIVNVCLDQYYKAPLSIYSDESRSTIHILAELLLKNYDYVVFEGAKFSGKTTIINKLTSQSDIIRSFQSYSSFKSLMGRKKLTGNAYEVGSDYLVKFPDWSCAGFYVAELMSQLKQPSLRLLVDRGYVSFMSYQGETTLLEDYNSLLSQMRSVVITVIPDYEVVKSGIVENCYFEGVYDSFDDTMDQLVVWNQTFIDNVFKLDKSIHKIFYFNKFLSSQNG